MSLYDSPFIIFSDVEDDADCIFWLEMGADDCLKKPFNSRELIARVKAVLRRTYSNRVHTNFYDKESDSEILKFEGWCLNTATRQLFSSDNVEIQLSKGKYELLEIFVNHARKILSRDQLLKLTRNRLAGPFDRSIDVQVSRLRQKLEENPKQPQLIKTIRGNGYMLISKVERK